MNGFFTTMFWRGASLLFMIHHRLLLGAKVDSDLIRLTGIGGRIEGGESARDCGLRECLEETGVPATIVPSELCLDVALDGSCQWISSHSRGIASIRRFGIAPPGEPWSSALSSEELQVEMFAARLDSKPQPIEKLRFLVALSPKDLVLVLQRKIGS